MIKIYCNTDALNEIERITTKNNLATSRTEKDVRAILSDVKQRGNSALKEYAEKFGDHSRESLLVPMSEMSALADMVTPEAKRVIEKAAESIRQFAQGLTDSLKPVIQKRDGYSIGLEFSPVEKAVCYVPGGRFPLPSTALMTAIPARVAGVKEVLITSPSLAPEVAYASLVAGAGAFYCLGGAQAVAAFAFGTKTIPRMDMIVGPGNAWVTEAKKQVQGFVGIDMLAGPSEVAIIADKSANPEFVILDILAQAEHDPDARAWLLTDSEELAATVAKGLPEAVNELGLPDFIEESLGESGIFILRDLDECVACSNLLAPEHLHINTEKNDQLKRRLKHYGSLFIGQNCTVPFGDYLAGPNHTLPTGTSARFSSGLSPLTFMRTQTWTKVEGDVSELAKDVGTFADLEGLKAHGAAARLRSY